jgi:hypothetical protein
MKTENDPGHRDGLSAALNELDSKEREIVAALEGAGVHDDTTNLSDAPQDVKEQILENVDALAERDAETAPEGGLSDTESEKPTDPEDADDEVGSFTMGKCAYCGRDWGVTLEGAPGGGYPTQRTANAAATRACNCEEATAHNSGIIGVALAVTTGACRHCGQLQEVGPHPSQKDADETAAEVCSCPNARIERRVTEQIADANDRVNRLFGETAEELGFKPIAEKGPVELLDNVVELIARRLISSATVQIRGQCKAKISLTTKGKIKVERSETRSCGLEAGE